MGCYIFFIKYNLKFVFCKLKFIIEEVLIFGGLIRIEFKLINHDAVNFKYSMILIEKRISYTRSSCKAICTVREFLKIGFPHSPTDFLGENNFHIFHFGNVFSMEKSFILIQNLREIFSPEQKNLQRNIT